MWTLHGRSGLGVRPDSSRARKGSNTSSQYSLTRSTCQHPPRSARTARRRARGRPHVVQRDTEAAAHVLRVAPVCLARALAGLVPLGPRRRASGPCRCSRAGRRWAHLVPRPDVQPDHTVPLLDQQLRGDRRVDATRDADSHQRRRLRASSRERAAAPCRSARHGGRHRRRKDRAAQSSPEPPHRRLSAAVGSELRRSRRAGMGSGSCRAPH